MRFRYLDLIRYGCFTDLRVDLPLANPDIHILVGPNEAGKSTVKAALEDVLFGIPIQSGLNFLHAYRDMRLGAVLESNGNCLAIRRRKGAKQTLRAEDDTPLPNGERALEPYIGDSSRGHFERMFSLDHERLRRGGQEILDAKGDLGEALFAASSGFQGLRGLSRSLDRETEAIWTRSKSKKRLYYQAEDRRLEAERQIRQHTVHVGKWQKLRDELEAQRRAHADLTLTVGEIERELHRLNRIRRVARHLRNKARLDEEIRGLGEIAPLPKGARKTLEEAEARQRTTRLHEGQRQEDLDRTRRDRAKLTWDNTLLLRGDEIEQLHESRIRVQTSRSDLPKREAELSATVQKVRDLARELGWEDPRIDDLCSRIPPRLTVTSARKLLSDRADHLARIEAAGKALADAIQRLEEADTDLRGSDAAADTSQLRSVLSARGQDSSSIPAEIRSTERELEQADAAASALFERLRPQPESIVVAVGLAIPSADEVKPHLDQREQLDHDLGQIANRIRSTESSLGEAREACERIVKDERPVGQQVVSELRSRRDAGWQLVRRKYVEGEDVPEHEIRAFAAPHSSLAWAYEKSVESADSAADRWVTTANAAARLEQAQNRVQSLVELLESDQRERSTAERARNEADEAWQALWRSVPFQPIPHEGALVWLDTYEQLRQAVAKRDRSQRDLLRLRDREAAASASVLSELDALGIDTTRFRGAGLLAIIELGREERERLEKSAQVRTTLEAESKRASAAVNVRRKELAAAEANLADWHLEWSKSVIALGFRGESNPELVEEQIGVIDSLRQAASEMANLRDKRVALIRRDIADFETSVGALVESIAPDLSEFPADDAAVEMEARLATSRDAHRKAEEKDRQILELEGAVRTFEQQRAEALAEVTALQQRAGVADVESLWVAIDNAEKAQERGKQLDEILRVLSADGDGLSIEDLEKECRSVDPDRAASKEQELDQEITDLRRRQDAARDALRAAEMRFEEVGGSDAAAVAEAARQDALAEIREVAQQYIQKRTAAHLLQWSVERNRRQRQGPMLRRAGKLFSELTIGSFEELELDFDANDRAVLMGRRPTGERVEMDGMSAGSVDQLYLALRIAALEEYARASGALPFVADDLFVNFDDRRSAAGFRVLAQLAGTYQVIFLTHHDHLAEVANLALAGNVQVWRFPRKTPETIAGASSRP